MNQYIVLAMCGVLSFIITHISVNLCVLVLKLNVYQYFFSQGEEWQTHRSALNRHMLRPRTVEQYTKDLNEVLDDAMSKIEGRTSVDGEIKDLGDILFRWSLECKYSHDVRYMSAE